MDDRKKFRQVLFWIIAIFFIVITLLTILNLFFGIGGLDPEFRPKLFTAFIVQIAAALFALFYAVFGLKKEKGEVDDTISHDTTVPAQKEVNEEDIQKVVESKREELYTGPDRSYLINFPPAHWSIIETSYAEYYATNLRFINKQLTDNLQAKVENFQNVVVFRSDKKSWIQPKPGQTSINESNINTAWPFEYHVELLIIPVDRYRPPLYYYASPEKILINFVDDLGATKNFKITSINSSVLKGTNRKLVQTMAFQSIQNAILNENEFAAFDLHHHFYCVEGDKKHYFIKASFIASSNEAMKDFKDDEKILLELVSSFRPLKVNDPSKAVEEEKANVYEIQRNLNETNGHLFLATEMEYFLLTIDSKNLQEKTKETARIIKTFDQFREFSKLIALPDELKNITDKLWGDLDKFKAGNTGPFIAEVENLIGGIVSRNLETPETETPGPTNTVPPN